MKAVQIVKYGGPEVLTYTDIDIPRLKDREVLIKIEAIGVNYADAMRREGTYVLETPLPFVPGAEVAGTIVEVGKEVSQFSIGDRVVTLLGSRRSTGYAEFTVAHANGLIAVPKDLDMNSAAALLSQGLTAYHILTTMGRLASKETVLVHAAAGGVGTLAVQLAKLFGAGKVIATASTQEKLAFAKKIGADICINYNEDGWEEEVLKATGGMGVDVALEMAGGDIFQKTIKCLAPFGRLVVYGLASGQQATLYPTTLLKENQSVIGFFLPGIIRKQELYKKSLEDLISLVTEGKLKLTIGGVYPLEQAAEVHRLLQGRKTKGKMILTPSSATDSKQ